MDKSNGVKMISLSKLVLLMIFSITAVSLSAKETSKQVPKTSAPNKTEIREASNFFDESLNDLHEELVSAKDEGKKGVLLMFEMDECPFCARMKKTVLNRGHVQDYFKENFRILSVDVEGDLELTDFEGKDTTQKEFSLKQFRVRATPVFQFVDLDGKPLKNGRLTGATKDANEFMQFGKYIVEGDNEKIPFIRYKRNHKKSIN
jgi:thioredoxin-related protein